MRFAFKLCLALGKTFKELGEQMSSAEFAYWIAYNNVNLFGDERADWRTAGLACLYGNTKRTGNDERFKRGDFMWELKPAEEHLEQTPEEIEAQIDACFGGFLGEDG